MKKFKVHAIIQARMNSSRLPGKVMIELTKGKSILEHIISRISNSKYVNKIIVATTTNDTDNKIIELCKKLNIEFYRGPENNVLERYYKCALTFNSEIIVRITSDDPFKDSQLIDLGVESLIKNNYDYVTNSLIPTFPEGLDVEVFTFDALEKTYKEANKLSQKEHVTPYMYTSNNFKVYNFYSDKDYSKIRLTVDNDLDLSLARIIYKELYNENPNFFYEDILEFLNKNPNLIQINNHIKRNQGYLKSLSEDSYDE
jgi:spore coat polysaccharide biosynthesis protein SpsF